MESAPKSAPWHQSMTVLMIATLLLPPLGLVLLWMRKDSGIGKKIFASFAILGLVASYLFFAYSHGLFARRDPNMEGHYDELERQRAEQRAVATGSSIAPSTADPNATNSAATTPSNANESKSGPVAPAVRSSRSYWTNYRGPARDGRY